MELVPSGVQNLMEAVIETINGLVTDVAGERGKRFFPFVATIFLFVLLQQLAGSAAGRRLHRRSGKHHMRGWARGERSSFRSSARHRRT